MLFEIIEKIKLRYKLFCRKNDELYKRKIKLIKQKMYEFYLQEGYSPQKAEILSKTAIIDAIKYDKIDGIYSAHRDFLRG